MINYELSKKIKEFIEGSKLEEINIGCSDSQVFKIDKDNSVYFMKIAKSGLLTQEYNALKWLNGKLEVPKIILYDSNNNVETLITESIKGEMVCSDNMLQNPDVGLKVIAEAFNHLYNVDYKDCPFNVGIDYKLQLVKNNVKNNLINYYKLKDETKEKFSSLDEIIKFLEDNKFKEEKCFSHGDTSLPNIFCYNKKFSGFIDVGECGIADKWFDLAICQKSIVRNYGEEYVEKFYKELNIEPDYNKINYYLLMMQLYL